MKGNRKIEDAILRQAEAILARRREQKLAEQHTQEPLPSDDTPLSELPGLTSMDRWHFQSSWPWKCRRALITAGDLRRELEDKALNFPSRTKKRWERAVAGLVRKPRPFQVVAKRASVVRKERAAKIRQERADRFIAAFKGGKSIPEIAREQGCSDTVIRHHILRRASELAGHPVDTVRGLRSHARS